MITLLTIVEMIHAEDIHGTIVRDDTGKYWFSGKTYGDPVIAQRNYPKDWITLEPNHLKAITKICKLRKLSLSDYEVLS